MDLLRCTNIFGVSKDIRLVLIREQHFADANFVFVYLMKQILQNNNRIVALLTHNSIGHYQCTAKRVGFNFMNLMEQNELKVIDVGRNFVNFEAKQVLFDVQTAIAELATKGSVYLFVDDLSHFLDLGLGLEEYFRFVNALLGANDDCRYVIGCHVDDKDNDLVCKDLEYNADVLIDVSMLKTGRSKDVTGLINVSKEGTNFCHHYKAKESGIQIFKPGELLKT